MKCLLKQDIGAIKRVLNLGCCSDEKHTFYGRAVEQLASRGWRVRATERTREQESKSACSHEHAALLWFNRS